MSCCLQSAASYTRAAAAGARNFSFRVHGRSTDAKHGSSQQVMFALEL